MLENDAIVIETVVESFGDLMHRFAHHMLDTADEFTAEAIRRAGVVTLHQCEESEQIGMHNFLCDCCSIKLFDHAVAILLLRQEEGDYGGAECCCQGFTGPGLLNLIITLNR